MQGLHGLQNAQLWHWLPKHAAHVTHFGLSEGYSSLLYTVMDLELEKARMITGS